MDNNAIENMTTAEFNLYCDLLHHAYKLYQEKTGLVCGSDCESLRDKMFLAIKTIL